MRLLCGIAHSKMLRLILFAHLFVLLASCGKKAENYLIVKLIPKETLVLEFSAYSCFQILTGIRLADGSYVTPAITGPVVQFNRMTMEWTKKDTKLYVHSAKLKFRGGGIQGGETSCDITGDLPALFESTGANNSAVYSAGGFTTTGKATSNPNCRVACSMPLNDTENPEISASGELIVKASEVTNEGTDEEKYFRVKTNFRVRVKP